MISVNYIKKRCSFTSKTKSNNIFNSIEHNYPTHNQLLFGYVVNMYIMLKTVCGLLQRIVNIFSMLYIFDFVSFISLVLVTGTYTHAHVTAPMWYFYFFV